MAAVKLYNLARVATATTGTGTLTLGSAVAGFLTFAQAGASDGETVRYAIKNGAASEIGYGVYTASGTTLTRNVLKSTNSNNALDLAGSSEVIITAAAEDFMQVAGWETGTAASAPSIFGAGDTNTGIYFPAADTVGITTGGTQRYNVGSTGIHAFTTATSLNVGANGATNPVFKVDPSAASVATGLSIVGAAAASGLAVSVISSGTNESLTVDAKGSGTITLNATGTGLIALARVATIVAGTVSAPGLTPTGDANTGLWAPAADTLAWSTAGTERVRIDSSGRVLVGHTASIDATVTPVASALQVHGTTPSAGSTTRALWSADTSAPNAFFLKSRGAAIGTRGIVASGDSLGTLNFRGDDGTNFIAAASITAVADGTPGTNDMPGRLIFGTTAVGASAITERMRIDSSGRVVVGGSAALSVDGGTTYPQMQNHGTDTATSRIWTTRWSNNSTPPSVIVGKSRGATVGSHTIVQSGDVLGRLEFVGSDGTLFATGAQIYAEVDGTPGSTDLPGRLVFGTTADGAGSTTERMRISSTGQVLIAHTADVPIGSGSTQSPQLVVHGLSTDAQAAAYRWANSTGGAALSMAKSRGATVGSRVIVQSGDTVGTLTFFADDGTNWPAAASISGAVDGTPGAGDMPGRLVFSTTADGAASATERMRIDSTGNVNIGTAGGGPRLLVQTTAAEAVRMSSSAANGGYMVWVPDASTLTYQGSMKAILGAGNASDFAIIGTGANVFALGTNSVERMRIDGSGNVGIGAASNGARLYVSPASSHPTNGIDTFGVVTTGAFGGGFGLIDSTGNIGIWAEGTGGSLVIGYGSSLGTVTGQYFINSTGNIKTGASSNRGTTEGTNQFVLFNGTAPVGTLSNGISLYSSSGHAYAMNAAGVAQLLTLGGGLPAILSFKVSVNFNAGSTDTAIPITLPTGYTRYAIDFVRLSGASGTLTTATVGVFSSTGGGGTTIVTSGAITVSTASEDTANNSQFFSIAAGATPITFTGANVYVRVGTPQGSAATGTMTIGIIPVS